LYGDTFSGKLTADSELHGTLSSVGSLQGTLSETQTIDGSLGGELLRGFSAYDIAVRHGYEGTEEEWIAETQAGAVKFFDELPSVNEGNSAALYVIRG